MNDGRSDHGTYTYIPTHCSTGSRIVCAGSFMIQGLRHARYKLGGYGGTCHRNDHEDEWTADAAFVPFVRHRVEPPYATFFPSSYLSTRQKAWLLPREPLATHDSGAAIAPSAYIRVTEYIHNRFYMMLGVFRAVICRHTTREGLTVAFA